MQRPLLILDIDETLLHSTEEPLARECDLRVYDYHVYLRPHVRLFLALACEHYDLACWSSATRNYLAAVVKELFTGLPAEPLFIWDRRRCTRRFDFVEEEEFFLKDLKKVRRKGWDLDRVVILEDEPRKVQRHYGNAIYVHPYVGAQDDNEF